MGASVPWTAGLRVLAILHIFWEKARSDAPKTAQFSHTSDKKLNLNFTSTCALHLL